MDGFAVFWIFLIVIVTMQFICYLVCHDQLPGFVRATYEWGKFLEREMTADHFSRMLLVPKRYFTHFYLLGSMYTAYLIFTVAIPQCQPGFEPFHLRQVIINLKELGYFYSSLNYTVSTSSIVLSLMLLFLQTLRRLYECIFISRFSQSAKMHIGHYLLGLLFYVMASMTIISAGSFLKLDDCVFDEWDPLTVRHYIGVFVFVWASYHQYRSHHILAQLREGKTSHDNYGIPHGDLFEYVACPHYFWEIVIYMSIGLILGSKHQTWWILQIFITAMLSLGAIQTKKWYCSRFANYPKSRKALFPYLL